MSDQHIITLNNGGDQSTPGTDTTPLSENWNCQFCKDTSKPDSLKEEQSPFWWRISGDVSKTQKLLAKKLESRNVHIIIVALTLLDLSLILTDLCLFSFYPLEEEAPEAVRTASDIFAWISVGILSVFTLEQLAKLVVFGPSYFIFSFWHALDAFIIIASLVLEIVLRGAAREVTALLIIFRLWRLVRIMHSIAEEVSIEHGESIEKHHELEKEMQKRINELERGLQLPPSPPMTLNGTKPQNNQVNTADAKSKTIFSPISNDMV
jgi:voltage-gated hydrogen channel 1